MSSHLIVFGILISHVCEPVFACASCTRSCARSCEPVFARTQLCEISDDDRPLGYYGVDNGMEIHVVDEDPYSLAKNGGLEDVSLVRGVTMYRGRLSFRR